MSIAFFFVKHPKLIRYVVGGFSALALFVACFFGAIKLRDHYIDQGFKRAEAQYTAAVLEANKRTERDNHTMELLSNAIGSMSERQQQEINLTLKPIFERIQDAVQTDPRYRDCVIDQRVLDDLQAGRSAVNQTLGASDTSIDR